MKKYIFLGLITILFTLSGCGSDSTGNGVEKSKESNQTMLLGWYLTGSDLESDTSAAGTTDLLELVAGYNTLTKQQQESINLQVIFGGANKEGWKGTKYADMACILQDAQDQVFGNDSCYLKEDLNANMGDPATLANFLTYLETLGAYDKKMLNFWNHGGAYKGICYDENHNDDLLTLNELKNVFEDANSSFDLIGMDACLMANYSVAETLRKHANYLLASEELEPGHGWQYKDVITAIGEQDDKNITTIAKKMIDSFINSPDHNTTSGKTLSLIDLTKVQAITDKFDRLNDSLVYSEISTFKPTVNAILNATPYGKGSTGALTYDFYGYLKTMATEVPESNDSITPITEALDQSIVYSRYQSDKEGSHGMSIANPFNILLNSETYSGIRYREIDALSNVWKRTVNEFIGIQRSDIDKPIIRDFEANCTNDSGEIGTCMHLSDNTMITKIHYNLFVNSGNDSYLKINAIDFKENLEDDEYFFPNQDNSSFMLCDEEEGCSFIPLEYVKNFTYQSVEYDQFTMSVLYDGKPAQLTLYVEFLEEKTRLEYTTVTLYTDDGVLGRSEDINPNSNITYQLNVYTLDGTRKDDESISVGPIPVDILQDAFVFRDLNTIDEDMKVQVNIEVEDLNRQKAYSQIF